MSSIWDALIKWEVLINLSVTLVGTFVGVLLAFLLEKHSREADARRHYANTLNSIRTDLSHLWTISKRASQHVAGSGTPFTLFPPDTPALDAALSNPSLHDRAPFSVIACLSVIANMRRSLESAFRQPLASRDNQALKAEIDGLVHLISYVQTVLDEEVKPFGKPVIKTPRDKTILDGLTKAMQETNVKPPSDASSAQRDDS